MKRKLMIEELAVDTFVTAPETVEGRGTVEGFGKLSRQGTCEGETCGGFQFTCFDSCQETCGLSCGGTCIDSCFCA